MATVHIIGAGISGLSASTVLAAEHIPVKLYEAASVAGGRCRSSRTGTGALDHGLHLISGKDTETMRYLERIGARETLTPVSKPVWPRASLNDYASLTQALLFPAGQKLAHFITEENPLYDTWATYMARVRLHTPTHEVSARAVRDVLLADRSGLFMAAHSLTESFITPALSFLEYCGGSVYFSHALHGFSKAGKAIASLNFSRKKVTLHADDIVILTTPAAFTRSVLPEVPVPAAGHAAITLAFTAQHHQPAGSVRFLMHDVADALRYDKGSIHAFIRVADGLWHLDKEHIAARIWKRLQVLHPPLRGKPLPTWSIWREKHAGHCMDIASMQRPAVPLQPHPQCILAGDWLDPRRSASIETAVASGHKAAAVARDILGKQPLRRQ